MIRQDWSTMKKLMFMKAAAGGGSAAVERTAIGNPMTFVTDIARPLKSLLIPFSPQQEGTGDPSPQNIRPILPWNGLTVLCWGKNLLKMSAETLMYKSTSNISFEYTETGAIISVRQTGGTYGFGLFKILLITPAMVGVRFVHHSDDTFASDALISCDEYGENRTSVSGNNGIIKESDVGKYLAFRAYVAESAYGEMREIKNVQVEIGQTTTAYEPYKPITETDIDFPALGKNLFNKNSVIRQDGYTIGYDGRPSASQTSGYTENFIPVEPSTDYTISGNGARVPIYYDKEKNFITRISGKDSPFTFRTPTNCYYVRLQYLISSVNFDNWQLEKGSSASAYEPYIPVYGGTLDVVSGVLTVEWVIKSITKDDIDGFSNARAYTKVINDAKAFTEMKDFKGNMVCDKIASESTATWYPPEYVGFMNNGKRFVFGVPDTVTDTAQAKALVEEMGGMVLVYQLATPQEIQLTPTQLTALVGDNTIWSDADGSMTAVYLVSGKYAEEHPVGGLSSGLGSGLIGSDPDPDEPIENQVEEPGEE